MTTTIHYFSVEMFSDLHKDAYGFRPRAGCEFYEASADRKQVIWDDALDALEASIKEERKAHEEAVVKFSARINAATDLGAADEETAIRWILEGENFSLNDYHYGADYVAYHFNLPYENRWSKVIAGIVQQKVRELDKEIDE